MGAHGLFLFVIVVADVVENARALITGVGVAVLVASHGPPTWTHEGAPPPPSAEPLHNCKSAQLPQKL